MQLGNVTLAVIILAVLLQAPVNGGLLSVAYKTFKTMVLEDFRWPWQKKLPKAATVYTYEGCNLCPWGECRPLSKPPDKPEFDLEAVVNKLKDTLSMLKSKEDCYFVTKDYKDSLLNIWISLSAMQKTAVAVAYKAKNNIEMRDEIEKMQIAPRYKFMMKLLVTPLPLFYAEQFSLCMKYQQLPMDAHYGRIRMLEMLISLPSCLIKKIIETYNNGIGDFFVDLKKSLEIAKMPSDYIDVVESLAKVKPENDNGILSWIRTFSDAYRLKKSIETKPIDKVKNRYSDLFTKRSFSHIVKTIEMYEDLKNEKGSFLKDFSQMEFGKVGEIYKLIMTILSDKKSYFATIMENILRRKGVYNGNFDDKFSFFFKSHLDIDLQDIIDVYNKQSKTGVAADIKSLNDCIIHPKDPLFPAAVMPIVS